MPTNKLIKQASAHGIGYGPNYAGIYVDSDDNKVKFNPDGTERELLDSSGSFTLSGASPLVFEGATADAYETTLTFTDPTADRTITVPDATGTVSLITNTETLTNKTLTSPVLTTPQINDTSADHQYVFAVSELAADRTVTLPLLTGADTFVFADFTQTLTNKTLTSPTIGTGCAMGAATAWSGTPTFTAVPSFIGATSGAVTAALLAGGGTAATPCATAAADKNFLGFWTKSTATSGDVRGMYLRTYFSGVGVSGEALRAYGTVDNVDAAVGGTVNGAHISLSVTGASGSVNGQGFASRFTLEADAQTRTLNGNMGCINLDSFIASGNTVPNTLGFIRVTDTGAVRVNQLFRLPNAANSTLVATHTTDAMSHSVRCVLDNGTVVYLMATTTATNRGGGS